MCPVRDTVAEEASMWPRSPNSTKHQANTAGKAPSCRGFLSYLVMVSEEESIVLDSQLVFVENPRIKPKLKLPSTTTRSANRKRAIRTGAWLASEVIEIRHLRSAISRSSAGMLQ